MAFVRLKQATFIHGCFLHHYDCGTGITPERNIDYWGLKLRKNQERDASNQAKLREHGWGVLMTWECEMRELESVKNGF